MKNILITGGAGFIGSNFVKYIMRHNEMYNITVLDNLTYAGNIKNLYSVISDINFIKGDICNLDLVKQVSKNQNIIVHLAAESHVDNSITDCDAFINTNIIGTKNLLHSAVLNSVDLFLHVSTDEVYGDLNLNSKEQFNESSIIRPNNPYSFSKAASDLAVMVFHKTYNLNCIITRCSNNYGPSQHPEKFIPKCIINSITEKKIPIYGNGMNIRNWIFVEDHCSAILAAIKFGRSGEIYNISSRHESTNIEIARDILQRNNSSFDLINYVFDRPGHDKKYSINSDKIRNDLGWADSCKWSDSIENTIKWYKDNVNWWDVN